MTKAGKSRGPKQSSLKDYRKKSIATPKESQFPLIDKGPTTTPNEKKAGHVNKLQSIRAKHYEQWVATWNCNVSLTKDKLKLVRRYMHKLQVIALQEAGKQSLFLRNWWYYAGDEYGSYRVVGMLLNKNTCTDIVQKKLNDLTPDYFHDKHGWRYEPTDTFRKLYKTKIMHVHFADVESGRRVSVINFHAPYTNKMHKNKFRTVYGSFKYSGRYEKILYNAYVLSLVREIKEFDPDRIIVLASDLNSSPLSPRRTAFDLLTQGFTDAKNRLYSRYFNPRHTDCAKQFSYFGKVKSKINQQNTKFTTTFIDGIFSNCNSTVLPAKEDFLVLYNADFCIGDHLPVISRISTSGSLPSTLGYPTAACGRPLDQISNREEFFDNVVKINCTCTGCQLIFPSPYDLAHHNYSVHRSEVHSCIECRMSFASKALLRNHTKKHLKCPDCKKYFHNQYALNRHRTAHHSLLDCPICKRKFKIKWNVTRHLNEVHSNKREFVCNICKKASKNAMHLMLHIAMVHSEKRPFTCSFCKRAFKANYTLTYHLTHHCTKNGRAPKPLPAERKFTCSFCKKAFYKIGLLNKHIKWLHPEERTYSCTMCESQFKGFGGIVQLVDHMETFHSREANFPCPTCKSNYKEIAHLREHVKVVHNNGERFYCLDCSKVFSELGYLKDHMVIHIKERNFACTEPGCKKTFKTNVSLNKHIRVIHTTEKNYACTEPGCTKAFKTNGRLNQHVRVVHTEERNFACTEPGCKKAFKTNAKMKNHIRVVHTKEKNFICTETGCSKAFKTNAKLKDHVRKVHIKEGKFTCTEPGCAKTFNTKVKLKDHANQIHSKEKKHLNQHLKTKKHLQPTPTVAQLAVLGLTRREIEGDGNCLFRALADQMDGSQDNHAHYRAAVVQFMRENRQLFVDFMVDNVQFENYLRGMSRNGTWGGQPELFAFSRLYNARVILHQTGLPTTITPPLNPEQEHRTVHVYYNGVNHYESIQQMQDHNNSRPELSLF